MPKTDLNFHAGHRERLRQKFLANEDMPQYELLELLLTYAIPRIDVRMPSRALMNKYNAILNVISTPMEELQKIPGIGRNAAILMKVVAKITKMQYVQEMKETSIFTDDQTIANYCKMILGKKTIEELHILYLDPNGRLLEDQTHSIGAIDRANIFTTEIARHALLLRASHVVMTHNHPRHSDTLSDPDIEATRQLDIVLKTLDMRVYDHILVAGGKAVSARATGALEQILNPTHKL